MTSSVEHFQSTLGRAGLKVSASSILDLADPLYGKVPEEIRAAAWLSAKNQGWTEDGIKMIVRQLMGLRYDEDTVSLIVDTMKEAAQKYPNIL